MSDQKEEIANSEKTMSLNEKMDNLVIGGNSENKAKDDDEIKSEGNSSLSNHIKNMDIYEKMNFKKIKLGRNSRKAMTNVPTSVKINIERYTDEIIKYTEEVKEIAEANKTIGMKRQRTIKFATQKTTFQYPNEKVMSTFKSKDTTMTLGEETLEEKEDEDENVGEGKKLFGFGGLEDENEIDN